MHAGLRRYDEPRRRPVERETAVRGGRRLLADVVVRRHVLARIRIEYRILARIAPHHLAGRVRNVETHFTRIARQVVIEQRSWRRALARGELGRPRRRLVDAEAYTHCRSRLEEI